jgi:hypothetical protein
MVNPREFIEAGDTVHNLPLRFLLANPAYDEPFSLERKTDSAQAINIKSCNSSCGRLVSQCQSSHSEL